MRYLKAASLRPICRKQSIFRVFTPPLEGKGRSSFQPQSGDLFVENNTTLNDVIGGLTRNPLMRYLKAASLRPICRKQSIPCLYPSFGVMVLT